ncbi:tail fiber protein [Escherichia coli]|uniref:tail fiber protein n=3 Tax=Escherichia coli TaxID=562 RepID=UPI00098CEAC3|nr:tail fiber protein [Escherichia coli]
MNDVTVVTSVTYPSPESLALVADVQYHEPYLSAALNRKFRGIVDPGFYAGFLPKPGGGMNLLITSVDGDKTAGAASVDIGEFYQVTIQHRKDISLALSAGKKYAIVLKGRYLLGEDTYQVNTASHIHAAEFVTRTYTDSYQLGDGELLVCTVNIPAGVSAITQEMIDTSERINRTIGIDISDTVTSSRSDVAASSLAVKKAYDLAKSKYTAQDASTTQKGLVQLSSETNSDSETMAATPKAVKSVKDLADTKAPIESPSLTGTPTAPTAAQGTNSTQIANTAFVKAAITALINGAPGTLDTLKEIAAAINNDPNFSTTINNALALKAPLASPALTGIPTAPTAAQGTNNTQIATTAYVRAAISALVGSSPEALDTLNELAAALGNDPNFATTMTNALAGKQPLDATLTALAGLATGANKLPYFTGTDTVAQTDLTSVGRDILAKTSTQGVIQYLGLEETIKLASEALSTYGGLVNGDMIIKGILSLIGNELLIEKDNGFSGIHIRNKSTVAGSANGVDFSFGGAIMSSLICGIMENGANYIDVALSPAGNISDRRLLAFTLDGNIRQLIPRNGWSIQGYTKNSDFTQAMADAGWVRFPNGIIFQWCWGNTDASGWAPAPFPVGWPVRCFGLLACNVAGDSIASAIAGVKRLNDRDMQVTLMERSGGAVSKPFFCIGVGC